MNVDVLFAVDVVVVYEEQWCHHRRHDDCFCFLIFLFDSLLEIVVVVAVVHSRSNFVVASCALSQFLKNQKFDDDDDASSIQVLSVAEAASFVDHGISPSSCRHEMEFAR